MSVSGIPSTGVPSTGVISVSGIPRTTGIIASIPRTFTPIQITRVGRPTQTPSGLPSRNFPSSGINTGSPNRGGGQYTLIPLETETISS